MGDRGNVIFKYEDGEKIYFYSHWGGSGLKETVRKALIKANSKTDNRWDDESYLARIVFCEMIKDCGGTLEETTGFGIAPYEMDNEYDLVEVDTKKQTVNGIPFADYIKSPQTSED